MGNTIIRNHPQGKMAKEYLGEDAKLYTTAYDGEDDPDTVAALDALNAECAAKVAEAEDAIVKKLDSEKDEEKRKALYAEAEAKKAEIEAGYAEPREKLLVQLKDRADARMELRRSVRPGRRDKQGLRAHARQDNPPRNRAYLPEHPPVSALSVLDNVLIAKHMRAQAERVFRHAAPQPQGGAPYARGSHGAAGRAGSRPTSRTRWRAACPYGIQRRLEIARALATSPKLLLLDEPAAGMNPQETQELGEYIVEIKKNHDLTILMIEHHMDLVMQFSDRIYVIDFGQDDFFRHARRGKGGQESYRRIPGGGRMSDVILSIKDLKVSYGGIEAVKGISFDVRQGEIVTLIGANGAGKSSTLRAISGLVKPSGGSISFEGQDITGKNPTDIVKQGVTLVPEGRRIFADLTVLENLRIGAYLRHDDLKDDIEWVYSLFPRLKERSWQAGGTLSGGEQQMLAVGRALMSRPKLIMMDEPSLGLAPIVVRGIFDIIREINKRGTTILLIEQNANMALQTADTGYVMETGRITLTGTGEELLKKRGSPGGLSGHLRNQREIRKRHSRTLCRFVFNRYTYSQASVLSHSSILSVSPAERRARGGRKSAPGASSAA